jgi:hypothetical protein
MSACDPTGFASACPRWSCFFCSAAWRRIPMGIGAEPRDVGWWSCTRGLLCVYYTDLWLAEGRDRDAREEAAR